MADKAKTTAAGLLEQAQTEFDETLAQPQLSIAPLPLPAVALRIVNMPEDEYDAVALAGLIQKDAGLAAQIIKVANSALYARRSPVMSLQQAIAWLGIAEVRKLAVSCALRAQVFAGARVERVLMPVWTESLATACFCQEIARLGRRTVEQSYLGGLLHRSGYAALAQMLARHVKFTALLADPAALAQLAVMFETRLARLLADDWHLSDVAAAGMCYWRAALSSDADALARPARLALLEVQVARVLAAQLNVPGAIDEAAMSLELIETVALMSAELGLYQEDLQVLWDKRTAIAQTVESLQ